MRRFPSRPRRRPGPDGGFTLTEVMIALLVLVLGIASAVAFLAAITRASVITERTTTASGLAQAKIEELLTVKYSDLAGGSDTTADFQRTWTVTGDGHSKTATVNLIWTDIDGHARDLSMGTVVAP